MPFVAIVTALVQVQDPDGITTVSPLAAELIAVCTSEDEQDAALIVAACARSEHAKRQGKMRGKIQLFRVILPRVLLATLYAANGRLKTRRLQPHRSEFHHYQRAIGRTASWPFGHASWCGRLYAA